MKHPSLLIVSFGLKETRRRVYFCSNWPFVQHNERLNEPPALIIVIILYSGKSADPVSRSAHAVWSLMQETETALLALGRLLAAA